METVYLIINNYNKIIILLSTLIFFSCSNSRKEQILYGNGKLKKEWVVDENGKKNGKLFEYYEDGSIRKVQHWEHGHLEGKEVAYHGNGKIAQIFNYFNGKRVGQGKLYLPSGQLIEIQYYDSSGNKMNFERYNPDGTRSVKMMGLLNSIKDTISQNEDYRLSVRLGNISNPKYQKGILILTSGWDGKGTLLDTLEYVESDSNFYELKIKPSKLGLNEIYMCLFYEIPLDTIKGVLFDRYCYEKKFYVVDSIRK